MVQIDHRRVYFVYLIFIERVTMVSRDPLNQLRRTKEQPYARANYSRNKLLVADSQTDYTGVWFRLQRRLTCRAIGRGKSYLQFAVACSHNDNGACRRLKTKSNR